LKHLHGVQKQNVEEAKSEDLENRERNEEVLTGIYE